jgi:hypothetical protein
MWEMPTIEDLGLVWEDVELNSAETWLNSEGDPDHKMFRFNGDNIFGYSSPLTLAKCYCSIKEIPKVEYTWCYSAPTDLLTCASELVEQGWIPLGGIDIVPGSNVTSQAFWRWAE